MMLFYLNAKCAMFFVKDVKALRLFGFQVCSTKSLDVLHRDIRGRYTYLRIGDGENGTRMKQIRLIETRIMADFYTEIQGVF